MLQFQEYSELARTKFVPFTQTEVTAIKCLNVLRKTSDSLGTYKDIMEWHLKKKKVHSKKILQLAKPRMTSLTSQLRKTLAIDTHIGCLSRS